MRATNTGPLVMSAEAEARFWSHVDKDGPQKSGPYYEGIGNCWTWRGVPTSVYNSMKVNGVIRKAHHIPFLLSGGVFSHGTMGCHHCDTPSCVRPSHVYAGTMAENVRDSVKRHPKMTDLDYVEAYPDVARRFRHGYEAVGPIAKLAGLSEGTVNRVRIAVDALRTTQPQEAAV